MYGKVDYIAYNQDVLIVDVREPDEVALGSIPSSVNLPLSELKDALSPNFGEGDFKKVRPVKICSAVGLAILTRVPEIRIQQAHA